MLKVCYYSGLRRRPDPLILKDVAQLKTIDHIRNWKKIFDDEDCPAWIKIYKVIDEHGNQLNLKENGL